MKTEQKCLRSNQVTVRLLQQNLTVQSIILNHSSDLAYKTSLTKTETEIQLFPDSRSCPLVELEVFQYYDKIGKNSSRFGIICH